MKNISLFLVIICSNILFPQLTVSESEKRILTAGYGETPENALKDAFRNAVEEAVGLFCQSTTMMENQELLEDKIYTYSNGFIKNYKNLGTLKTEDGFFQTNIVAIITKNQVREAISGAGISIDIEEQAGLLFAQFSSEKQRVEDEEKAMEVFLSNLNLIDPYDYKSHLVGMLEDQDRSTGQSQVIQDYKKAIQIVTVIPNDNYKNYFKTVNNFLTEFADVVIEDEFFFTGEGYSFYAISDETEQKIKSLKNLDNGRNNLFFMLESTQKADLKSDEYYGAPKKKKEKKAWRKRWRKTQSSKSYMEEAFFAKGKLYSFVSGNTYLMLSNHLKNFQKMGFQIVYKDRAGNSFKTITYDDFSIGVNESDYVQNTNTRTQTSSVFDGFLQNHFRTGHVHDTRYLYGKIYNISNFGYDSRVDISRTKCWYKYNNKKYGVVCDEFCSGCKNKYLKVLYENNKANNLINSQFLAFPNLDSRGGHGYEVKRYHRSTYHYIESEDKTESFNLNFFLHPNMFTIDYDAYFNKFIDKKTKENMMLFNNKKLVEEFFKLGRDDNAISLFGVENRLTLEEIGKVAKIEITPLKSDNWMEDVFLEAIETGFLLLPKKLDRMERARLEKARGY